jgi:hypothetical protein
MKIYLQKVEKKQDAIGPYYEATYSNGLDTATFNFPIKSGEVAINIPSILPSYPMDLDGYEKIGIEFESERF